MILFNLVDLFNPLKFKYCKFCFIFLKQFMNPSYFVSYIIDNLSKCRGK
jgi:hypothetical protein